MGKRFIAKADLLTPPLQRGFSLGLEMVLFKRVSLTADFIRTSTRHAYNYEFSSIDNYNDDFRKFNTLKNGKSKIISQGYRLSLRRYLSRSIYAPLGIYVEYLYGFGKSTINGQSVIYGFRISEDSEVLGTRPLGVADYTLKGAQYHDFGIGWGVQRVIRDRFSIDCYLGFNYRETWASNAHETFFDGKNKITYAELVNQHRNLSGSNLFTLLNDPGARFNTGIGIHARLQIGYLLF